MLKIENVLPNEGKKHIFENVMYEPRFGQHSCFASRSANAERNENLKNQVDAYFGGPGGMRGGTRGRLEK